MCVINRRRAGVVSQKLSKVVVGGALVFGGWKGVHSGKARPDPGHSRIPQARRSMGAFIIEHRNLTHHRPSFPLPHAHLVYYRQDVTTRGADDPPGSCPLVRDAVGRDREA
jgi:hypothetical protein